MLDQNMEFSTLCSERPSLLNLLVAGMRADDYRHFRLQVGWVFQSTYVERDPLSLHIAFLGSGSLSLELGNAMSVHCFMVIAAMDISTITCVEG